MALLLACRWQKEAFADRAVLRAEEGDYRPTSFPPITIPKHTYVGVPMSIMHAGFDVAFDDREWLGQYELDPLPVVDSARLFTSGLFEDGFMRTRPDWRLGSPAPFICVSFHWSKTLAIGQGGAILHDNDEADEWFRMMRFDGRQEGVEPRSQKDWVLGYHCYMSPRDAAEGLSRLSVLPEQNDPLPNDNYPDLSKIEIFQ
jgi:hypothetical protein